MAVHTALYTKLALITKVYAHILDEDRKLNAQKSEAAFYAKPDLRDVKPPQENGMDIKTFIEQLQKSPVLANTLAQIIKPEPEKSQYRISRVANNISKPAKTVRNLLAEIQCLCMAMNGALLTRRSCPEK